MVIPIFLAISIAIIFFTTALVFNQGDTLSEALGVRGRPYATRRRTASLAHS